MTAGQTEGRPVIVSTFLTLDGYMVGPDEDISWAAESFDAEMEEDVAAHLGGDTDAILLGRVTYEMFAAYWPHAVPRDAGDGVAPSAGREHPLIVRALNDAPKVVVSRTLTAPEWAGTTVAADPVDAARRLRAQPGRGVSVQGSASVVQALAAADLVDEYRLYVHPVLLGAGKPLFSPGHARQDFSLVDHKRYANGVVGLCLRRAKEAR